MDQEQIHKIHQQFPWASEITLEKVSSNMTLNNVTMASIAAVLGKKDAAAIRELARNAETSEVTVNKSANASLRAAEAAGGAMKMIMKSQSPVNATAELSHEAAKIIANAGIGLSNLGGGMSKWASGLKFVARHAGTPLVVATGMGIIFAKLLTEQEKQARQLIDFGAVVSDIDHWTDLRYATRNLGMGIKDFADIMSETKPFIVQAEESAFEGALRLAEFAKEIDQDKTFRDFGMGIQDQTRFIAQEIETLYGLGELTSMNEVGKKRVIDSYKNANNLALFMGDTFGMQRSEALRIRDEARTNVALRVALVQNKDFIDETYGEAASANVENANAILTTVMTQLLGEDVAKEISGFVGSFVGGIKFDQTAANDISENMIKTIQAIPGASTELMALIEKVGTGQLSDQRDVLEAFRPFFKLIKESPFLVTAGDPFLVAMNDMIAHAETAAGAEEFLMADLDTVAKDSNYYANLADAADTSVEVMNNLSIAFQNMQEILTPGYGTMEAGFSTLSGSLMKFGRGVSKLFHGENQADNRFETFWEEHHAAAVDQRLAQINESNVVTNINFITKQVEQLVASQNQLETILNAEDGMAPDWTDPETGEVTKGEKLTVEERENLEAAIQSQADELTEAKAYLLKLQEKKVELLEKEEATVE